MRTTLDLPDPLFERVKNKIAKDKTTFRALVIAGLEAQLSSSKKTFKLKDASVGNPSSPKVSAKAINAAIEEDREMRFTP